LLVGAKPLAVAWLEITLLRVAKTVKRVVRNPQGYPEHFSEIPNQGRVLNNKCTSGPRSNRRDGTDASVTDAPACTTTPSTLLAPGVDVSGVTGAATTPVSRT
jgi:hypothetical protein